MKSSEEEARKWLKALLVALPGQGAGTEREIVATYLIAIEGIARRFVPLACRRFIQGLVQRPNLQFRPTPPELAQECRRLMEKTARSDRIAALPKRTKLPPPEPPRMSAEEEAAMRQRIVEGFRELRAELKAKAADLLPARRTPREHLVFPAPPRFDISDFPSRNATREELRAWEARQQLAAE